MSDLPKPDTHAVTAKPTVGDQAAKFHPSPARNADGLTPTAALIKRDVFSTSCCCCKGTQKHSKECDHDHDQVVTLFDDDAHDQHPTALATFSRPKSGWFDHEVAAAKNITYHRTKTIQAQQLYADAAAA
jgi:hypothetical protein